MATSFQIQPIGRASKVSLTLISCACAVLAALTWACRSTQPETMLVATVVWLSLAGLFAWFGVAQAKSSITVDGQTLVLRLPMYSRTIDLDRLIPASLTHVNADTGAPYQLSWRTNGLSVPGYNLGWFQTRTEGKVLAAMTRNDAVACKTKDGYSVLVSIADSEGFVDAVRQALTRNV